MSVYQCMLADISDVAAFLPKAVLIGILVGIVLRLCHVRGRQWTGSVLFVIYVVVLLQTVFFCREPGSRWGDGYAVVWYLGNDDAGSCMGA